MSWGAAEEARLMPCDDNKPQSAENPPFEAALSASVVVNTVKENLKCRIF